jgi:streptogramin lyase
MVGACGELSAVQGRLQVLAGGQDACGYRDGPLATAAFKEITGLAVAPDGGLIVADAGNNRIRRVSPDGMVSTVLIEGMPESPTLSSPSAIAVDPQGTIYVADGGNHRILARAADGAVRVVAGSTTAGFSDAQGTAARFKEPMALALGPAGALYVSDNGNRRIRRIAADGMVSTIAENVGDNRTNDVMSMAVDPYGTIYTVSPTSGLRRYRPNSSFSDSLDVGGPVGSAWPTAVALDSQRNLYVRDGGSELVQAYRIHRLVRDPLGIRDFSKQEVLVSDQSSGNETRTASFGIQTSPPSPPRLPTGLAVAPDGTVYFSRYRDCRLWSWRP